MPDAADRRLSAKLQGIGQGLTDAFNEIYGADCGFILILAPLGKEKTEVQYVSSIDREQSMEIIRTLFKRWQMELPDVPTHEKM